MAVVSIRVEQFVGCLLGVLLGDVLGAPVEGESPKYLAKTYRDLDHLLQRPWVEEVLGQRWIVGRYTDDTQMTLCVAEWLLEDWPRDRGRQLLARFAEAYRPGRRYGSGAARLLESFEEHQAEWQSLATLQFPEGSYGNGSSMRVAPIGLALAHDPPALLHCARLSSLTTHSHRLAQGGACLMARAVGLAALMPDPLDKAMFLQELVHTAQQLERAGILMTEYQQALAFLVESWQNSLPLPEVARHLGTGVEALESVPTALYAFLSHSHDFSQLLSATIFLGGDVDTLAAMAGALAGAHLGQEALPRRWLACVREEEYPPGRIAQLARDLHQRYAANPA